MIKIIEGNILDFKGDAIVNAANKHLLSGGGVCGAIFGTCNSKQLEAECQKIGYCETGDAVITSNAGFNNVKNIIHAVAPVYKADKDPESNLYNAYYHALRLAWLNDLHSIAFPSLGTGIFGYPLEEASKIAIRAMLDFLNVFDDMDIYLYAFNHETFLTYNIQKTLMEKENSLTLMRQ